MSSQATSNGVVFVEPWRATVARSGVHGPRLATFRRRHETRRQFLGRIAREIEACERLVVLGPDVERLELERELVLLTHRPDRIVRDEPAAELASVDLIRRLGELAA